jgi:hypothetical protein
MKRSTFSRFAANFCLILAVLNLVSFMGMTTENPFFWKTAGFVLMNLSFYWLNSWIAGLHEAKEAAEAAIKKDEGKLDQ